MKLHDIIQIRAEELLSKIKTEAMVIAGNTLEFSEKEVKGMLEKELSKSFNNINEG